MFVMFVMLLLLMNTLMLARVSSLVSEVWTRLLKTFTISLLRIGIALEPCMLRTMLELSACGRYIVMVASTLGEADLSTATSISFWLKIKLRADAGMDVCSSET